MPGKLSFTLGGLRLTQEAADQLRVIAEREDRPIGYVIRKAVDRFIALDAQAQA